MIRFVFGNTQFPTTIISTIFTFLHVFYVFRKIVKLDVNHGKSVYKRSHSYVTRHTKHVVHMIDEKSLLGSKI